MKRKAVKLVIAHLKRKLPENEFSGKQQIMDWINGVEELLASEEFVMIDYLQMRRNLNDIIERTLMKN